MPRQAKHPSVRARRNADGPQWRKLPSEGRGKKPAPTWPLTAERQLQLGIDQAAAVVEQLEVAIQGTEERSERAELAREMRREKGRHAALVNDARVAAREELALWRLLWRLPQAVQWELDGAERTVAQYVRFKIRAELGELGAARHVIQLDRVLGLSPKAMHDLRWEVATDEVGEARERNERQGAQGDDAAADRAIRTADGADPRGLQVV